MPFEPIKLDIDDLIRRYTGGETAENIANTLGVSSATILRRVKAAGIEVRQGPSYRTLDTEKTKLLRAKSRARLGLHIGPWESTFIALLDTVGVDYRQQVAIGKYNVDFALDPHRIAVEIVTGGGNSRSAPRRRERIEYILDANWNLVEVFVRAGRTSPMTVGSAEYLHAFVEELRGEPAGRGQHRMIWANGDLYAARTRHVD